MLIQTEEGLKWIGLPGSVIASPAPSETQKENDRQWHQAREDHIRRYEESMRLSHRFGRLLDQPPLSALRSALLVGVIADRATNGAERVTQLEW